LSPAAPPSAPRRPTESDKDYLTVLIHSIKYNRNDIFEELYGRVKPTPQELNRLLSVIVRYDNLEAASMVFDDEEVIPDPGIIKEIIRYSRCEILTLVIERVVINVFTILDGFPEIGYDVFEVMMNELQDKLSDSDKKILLNTCINSFRYSKKKNMYSIYTYLLNNFPLFYDSSDVINEPLYQLVSINNHGIFDQYMLRVFGVKIPYIGMIIEYVGSEILYCVNSRDIEKDTKDEYISFLLYVQYILSENIMGTSTHRFTYEYKKSRDLVHRYQNYKEYRYFGGIKSIQCFDYVYYNRVYEAIEKEDIKSLAYHLESNVSMYIEDKNNETPFHAAIKKDNPMILDMLFEARSIFDEYTCTMDILFYENKGNLLSYAVLERSYKCIDYLLDKIPSDALNLVFNQVVTIDNRIYRVYDLILMDGRIELIERCIGMKLDTVSHDIIRKIFSKGSPRGIIYYCEKTTEPLLEHQDDTGNTPIHYLTQRNLEPGTESKFSSLMKYLFDKYDLPLLLNNKGECILETAVHGDTVFFEQVISRLEPGIFDEDWSFDTLIDIIIEESNQNAGKHLELINKYIPELIDKYPDLSNRVIRSGNLSALEELLRMSVHDSIDGYGNTNIHHLITRYPDYTILINFDLSIDQENIFGITPIDLLITMIDNHDPDKHSMDDLNRAYRLLISARKQRVSDPEKSIQQLFDYVFVRNDIKDDQE